jgi:Glycosyl transferases group 1
LKVAIVTNIEAAIGLKRDFEIVSGLLTELGHEVTGIQFDAPREDPSFIEVMQADYGLTIFLEVLPVDLVRLSPVNWIFANAEWVRPEMVKLIERHCDKVFAKTHEAQCIFEPLWPGKVFYVGFTCRDQYDATVKREPKFLHIGGNSSLRGSSAVVDAWKWEHNGKQLKAELTIVSTALKERPEIPGVTYLDHVEETELKRLQNSHAFHIYPSATEGYGHAIHEAMSVGAVVLTTKAPPMDEIDTGFSKIPARKYGTYNLADLYEVSAIDIHLYVREMQIIFYDVSSRGEGSLSRLYFIEQDAEFKKAFTTHLQDIGPKRTPRKKSRDVLDIAFLGNFANPDSTENMIQWALTEGLGHQVEKLQENAVRLHDIREAAEFSDLLIWVRTPTFLKVPNEQMEEFLRTTQTKTCSIHLDKFFGIPEREALIGKIPFWLTNHVFTADGSMDEEFSARKVNHHWMTPAASEVFSHPGCPQERFLCDVGFVGARTGYHKEHPFRETLIAFLEQTYGGKFRLIEGVRGHELNDFYASCKVCVADCFGSGRIPFYWSDRMVETPMRHGFLLSPFIQGLNIPLPTFEPENLEDLRHRIDFWLQEEKMRKTAQKKCAEHVRRYDTWTVRMKEILGKVLHD